MFETVRLILADPQPQFKLLGTMMARLDRGWVAKRDCRENNLEPVRALVNG